MTNPNLKVEKKIVAEIYTSSEPMDNLVELCDIHGSRFPGTLGDKGSVDYMIKKFKEYGCENVNFEEYKIAGWKRGPAKLEIVSTIKAQSYFLANSPIFLTGFKIPVVVSWWTTATQDISLSLSRVFFTLSKGVFFWNINYFKYLTFKNLETGASKIQL